MPSTWFSLGVGFTGALLANAISSQSRLMGYSENDGADGADGLYVSGLDEKVSARFRCWLGCSGPAGLFGGGVLSFLFGGWGQGGL